MSVSGFPGSNVFQVHHFFHLPATFLFGFHNLQRVVVSANHLPASVTISTSPFPSCALLDPPIIFTSSLTAPSPLYIGFLLFTPSALNTGPRSEMTHFPLLHRCCLTTELLQQLVFISKEGIGMLAFISCGIEFKSQEVLLQLYKTFLQPVYCVWSWSLHYRHNVED